MSIDTSGWGWAQWTLLGLLLFELIVKAAKHGEPRADYNGFVAFLDAALLLFVLIAGGFFK